MINPLKTPYLVKVFISYWFKSIGELIRFNRTCVLTLLVSEGPMTIESTVSLGGGHISFAYVSSETSPSVNSCYPGTTRMAVTPKDWWQRGRTAHVEWLWHVASCLKPMPRRRGRTIAPFCTWRMWQVAMWGINTITEKSAWQHACYTCEWKLYTQLFFLPSV